MDADSHANKLTNICADDQPFCQVTRVEYKIGENGDSTWSLERNCSSDCRPFCVTMGGRTKVTFCSSCCRWDGLPLDYSHISPEDRKKLQGLNNSLCNIDNQAPENRIPITAHI